MPAAPALHQAPLSLGPAAGRGWRAVKSFSHSHVKAPVFRAPRAPFTCALEPQSCPAPGPEAQQATLEAAQQGPAPCYWGGDPELAHLQPASLSRAMIAVQPGRVASTAFRGRRGLTLPGTLLVFALTVGAAIWTGVRQRLQAVRDCQACKGYGIKRCKLCSGSGKISWEGKMAHDEPCPMCLGRRYTRCSSCGGLFARTTFMHLEAPGDTALVSALASLGESAPAAAAASARQRESGGGLLGGRGAMSRKGRQQIMEEVSRLAEEIMTD